MAKEFVMGASLRMSDDFTKPMTKVLKNTEKFSSTTKKATSTMNTFRSANGRAADSLRKQGTATSRTERAKAKMAKVTETVRRSLDRFKKSTDKSNKALRQKERAAKGASRAMKGVVAAAAGYLSFRAMTNVIGGWVEAAKDQIRAEERLQALMNNVPGTTQKGIDAVKSYAAELQGLTTIGDEVSITGASQLATFQLQQDSIKKLMPTMADLAVGTYGVNVSQEQMIQTGNMVGKVLDGQVGALSRVGISFNKEQEKMLKYGNEQERVAALMQVIEQNYGGLSETMRQTDEGKIIAFNNAWGDMREELGKKVLPLLARFAAWGETKIPAIQGFMERFLDGVSKGVDIIAKIGGKARGFFDTAAKKGGQAADTIKARFTEWYATNKPQLDNIASFVTGTVVPAFLSLWEQAKPGLEWIKDTGLPGIMTALEQVGTWVVNVAEFFTSNWADIAPFITGIAIALGIYHGTILTVQTATRIWAAAQWALNVALNANPIGLVITLIGLLIGAGIWLYKNWDKVKEAAANLWAMIRETPLGEWLQGRIDRIREGAALLMERFVEVRAKAGEIWEGIKETFDKVKEFMLGLPAQAFEWGSNIIKTMIDGILSMQAKLIESVTGVFEKVREFLPFSDAKKGPFSELTYSGGALITTVADGMESKRSNLITKASSIFGSVRKMLPFSDAKEGPFSNLTKNGGALITTIADGATSKADDLKKAIAEAFNRSQATGTNGTTGTNDTAVQPTLSGIIDPAGTAQGNTTNTRTINIAKLIEKLVIEADGRDPKELADEVIQAIYEKLEAANDIIGGGDMGELL